MPKKKSLRDAILSTQEGGRARLPIENLPPCELKTLCYEARELYRNGEIASISRLHDMLIEQYDFGHSRTCLENFLKRKDA